MKKIKVSEATGPVLDWLVAKALGLGYHNDEKYGPMYFRPQIHPGVVHWDSKPLPYSTDWAQGGPIFDEHRISRIEKHDGWWRAFIYDVNDDAQHLVLGSTSLIAAARCLVLSQLGDEVEVPEELT